MRWTRHVACIGEIGNAYNIMVGKFCRIRDYLEGLYVDGRIISGWIFDK
jgi:hypothetical protein